MQDKSAIAHFRTKLILFFQCNNPKNLQSAASAEAFAAFTLIRQASATKSLVMCVFLSTRNQFTMKLLIYLGREKTPQGIKKKTL